MSGREDLSKYDYNQNSNLVLKADRRHISKKEKETTGEAESLWGKISMKEMGTRSFRETPEELPVKSVTAIATSVTNRSESGATKKSNVGGISQ